MIVLSDGERISMIRSAVFIQTDRRTDGQNCRRIYRAQHSVARLNNNREPLNELDCLAWFVDYYYAHNQNGQNRHQKKRRNA